MKKSKPRLRQKLNPSATRNTIPAVPSANARIIPWQMKVLGVLIIGAVGLIIWKWWAVHAKDTPGPGEIKDPEVRAQIEDFREKVHRNPGSASAWGQLGMVFLVHGGVASADRCLAEASQLDPEDGHWPYYRALNSMREDPDQVLPFLRQALSKQLPPIDQLAIQMRLAEVLLERRELDEAEPLFLERWKQKNGDPRAGFGLGLIACYRGNSKEAENYFLAARSSPVVQKAATSQLAILARERGELKRAAELELELNSFPVESPPWPDPMAEELARLRLGAFKDSLDLARLEKEDRFWEMAQIYLKNMKKNPDPENRVGAGLNLVRSGHVSEGMKLLHQGIALDPKRSESYYGLALAWFHLAGSQRERDPNSRKGSDQFLEVVKAAQQATDLKPDYAEAYLVWGGALMGRGDFVEAIAPLKKGVACRPEIANLQLALGEALLESGRLSEAEVVLHNARKLDPKNERVQQALQRWQHKSK